MWFDVAKSPNSKVKSDLDDRLLLYFFAFCWFELHLSNLSFSDVQKRLTFGKDNFV